MHWQNKTSDTIPDEADMHLNEGVVSDRILSAYRRASERLTELGIEHLVVGGLAVGAWGHPRATKDVDFLVRQSDAFDGALFLTFKPGVPIQVDGVSIDYLTIESLGGRAEVFQGEVVPLPLLFAMKLRAHRTQDNADLVALIKAGAETQRIYDWLSMNGFAPEAVRLLRLVRVAEDEQR